MKIEFTRRGYKDFYSLDKKAKSRVMNALKKLNQVEVKKT